MADSVRSFMWACFLWCLLAAAGWSPASSFAAEYRQASAVIDLRSTFSDGAHDLEHLAALARERGFQALFLADHDRMAMEYGLYPLHGLLRWRVEKASVNKSGAEGYLAAIREMNNRYRNFLIIPGVESAPFYYWSGSPLAGNLTAHDWERHVLVFGLDRPEDYEGLPVLHNGFSTRFARERLSRFALFATASILGLVLVRWRGGLRVAGIVFTAFGAILALGAHPFVGSPFDPYHGARGDAPYQLFLDDVAARGGLAFWNHMETRSGVGDKTMIRVDTRPYPDVLLTTSNFAGFASVYGDTSTVTEPGGHWDTLLLDYCAGGREKPVWGIATADYHGEEPGSDKLGDYSTVFWVRELTEKGFLDAMRHGRMYAVQGDYAGRGILAEFQVRNPETGDAAISGGEARIGGPAIISLFITTIDESKREASVRLIRGGQVLETFTGVTPMAVDYLDELRGVTGKTYYRVDIQGRIGVIRSNPIFVSIAENSPDGNR